MRCERIVEVVVMMNESSRNYTTLLTIDNFDDRYEYLRIGSIVGESTFGHTRIINQGFYMSSVWKKIRDQVIIRDNGCDLGILELPIFDKIIVHHMNPITEEDIETQSAQLLDPEFLVCVSPTTHNAIHFGDSGLLVKPFIERAKNDMCPWLL